MVEWASGSQICINADIARHEHFRRRNCVCVYAYIDTYQASDYHVDQAAFQSVFAAIRFRESRVY